MPVDVQLITAPIGSQFTTDINKSVDPPEPDDKNDFSVLILTSENASGLTLDDLTLTARADNPAMTDMSDAVSIVSLDGENSVHEVKIRPPEESDYPNNAISAILTLTVASDAFSEGNTETTLDIRVSRSFPDDDAQAPTEVFAHSISSVSGIAATATGIKVRTFTTAPNRNSIISLDFSGTTLGTQTINLNRGGRNTLDYINGDYLISGSNGIYRVDGQNLSNEYLGGSIYNYALGHSRYGILTTFINRTLTLYAYDDFAYIHNYNVRVGRTNDTNFAVQDDLVYSVGYIKKLFQLNSFTEIETLRDINIATVTDLVDISIYQDTLYFLTDDDVQSLDIRPYRPIARNTKTTIYPVFADNGDTIPLKQYCPDAHTIVFDVGFDLPTWLSINSNFELEIADDAVSEMSVVFVRLKGINYIDATETGAFGFYLVVQPATAPVWRDADSLTMPANSTYDLFQIVDATSIAFTAGETQPTGATLSDGIFTIATTGGTAYFTATKDGLTSDKQITIDVRQVADPANFSDEFTYRVEIAGIDVTDDIVSNDDGGFDIEVSKSLDAIELNNFIRDSVSVTLSNDNTNGYKYNPKIENNFWETNNLNPAGYNEGLKIYRDSFVGGSTIEHLLFSGVITTQVDQITNADVTLTADDVGSFLLSENIRNFGTLQKWIETRRQSDEVNYEGIYTPEGSLLPLELGSGKAWSDRTALQISDLALASEGRPVSNQAYFTNMDVRTSGGFVETNPLVNVKTRPRNEDVRFLFDQLALNTEVYNTSLDIPIAEQTDPFLLNRGSVPYSVEDSRVTRRLTDWVYDPTNERVLMLVGQPEGHIADILVQYDVQRDSYRTLYTFDKDVKAHRIARRNATNYYILTSGAITQDRSAATLPRQSDTTGYAYDSVAEGALISVYNFRSDTQTLGLTHINHSDSHRPQLGIHYYVGFENKLYIDEFEGIRPDYRGAFKWASNNIYYRYARDGEFGVASAAHGGPPSEIVAETDLNYHNHLNFAFDVLSNGTVYFVYATGTPTASTLTIKSVISGTEATVFTDTQALADLTHLDDNGGAYLGCYECLLHSDVLYFFAPIQRVDEDDSTTPSTYTRSRTKASGLVLFSCNVTDANPTLTVLSKWEFATHGGCNLTIHDGAVHYVEQPLSAQIFKPINPDL